MFKKICVTDRHLVKGDFLKQIETVAETGLSALILREKDLTDEEYETLAVQVMRLCREKRIPCFFNNRPLLAAKLGADGVQMSFAAFCGMTDGEKAVLKRRGVSVHSGQEAVKAESLGADYLIFGHVFETECKPGIPPRGLETLKEICETVEIPVFAIGGISDENAADCIEAGAAGVCMMSGYMKMKK
ncbi:MAG: thiamine phosphate synthase [Emergencia sp.]